MASLTSLAISSFNCLFLSLCQNLRQFKVPICLKNLANGWHNACKFMGILMIILELNMKKIAFLLLMLTFVSCGSDKNSSGTGTVTQNQSIQTAFKVEDALLHPNCQVNEYHGTEVICAGKYCGDCSDSGLTDIKLFRNKCSVYYYGYYETFLDECGL